MSGSIAEELSAAASSVVLQFSDADVPALPPIDPSGPHPSAEHVAAIRAMVEEEIAGAGGVGGLAGNPAALLPLGQRILRRIIPYTEQLARSGSQRRAMMIEALQRGREAAPEQTRIAFDAALLSVRMGMDGVLVGALQDTRMLAQSAPRIARCIMALFRMIAHRNA